ncbi:MAG TPA: hypothetical protein VHH57_09430 [Gaiella sp.]|nr:hypothetical protein [Gaiella sp.]
MHRLVVEGYDFAPMFSIFTTIEVAPRDVVAAALPDPATLGERMSGKTCAGTLVSGLGLDGNPRKTHLYHVVDNEWSMREYGRAGGRLADGTQPGRGAGAPRLGLLVGDGRARTRGLPARPFLDKLAELGSPNGVLELDP